jgi:hypothetical protein
METLRKLLNKEEFDWDNGLIVWQDITEEAYSPGWASGELKETIAIDYSHEILDREFPTGFGAPQMPRFVAQDRYHMYFPCQYDGSTSICKIKRHVNFYLDNNDPTPYPGG